MLNLKSILRKAMLAGAATAMLAAGPAAAIDDEAYWYAVGDRDLPQGQLWVNPYGQCWQSVFGPSNLPPCEVAVVVPTEFTLRLNFEFDRYEMQNVVNRDEIVRLDGYIRDVIASPAQEFLTVVGHTDAVGSDEYNMALGMRRATTVRDYMIAQGVPANRIAPAQSRGKRELLPEYPADSVMQRRVVIHAE